jgi:hypothetical protein
MVQGYKQHRYFIRRGTRTVPMTEDEVRVAYEAVRTRAHKLGELLTQLPLLPRIGRSRSLDELRFAGHGTAPPAEWLPLASVIPAPFDASPELISPAHVGQESFPEPLDRYVGRNRLLRTHGYYTVDALGLIEEATADTDDEQPGLLVLNRVRILPAGRLRMGAPVLLRSARPIRHPVELLRAGCSQRSRLLRVGVRRRRLRRATRSLRADRQRREGVARAEPAPHRCCRPGAVGDGSHQRVP